MAPLWGFEREGKRGGELELARKRSDDENDETNLAFCKNLRPSRVSSRPFRTIKAPMMTSE